MSHWVDCVGLVPFKRERERKIEREREREGELKDVAFSVSVSRTDSRDKKVTN